jgi:hypothetical protein
MSGFGETLHPFQCARNPDQGASANRPKPAVRLNWARVTDSEPKADVDDQRVF